MQFSFAEDSDAVGIFARNHCMSCSAVTLSAIIARILYPLIHLRTENFGKRAAFWSRYVRLANVPTPMMSFLRAKFQDTNWSFLFLGGAGEQEQDSAVYRDEYPLAHKVIPSIADIVAAAAEAAVPAPAATAVRPGQLAVAWHER